MVLYVERQIFCFSHLDNPPYFINATLPQRLAKIRRIHLHYEECKAHNPSTEYDPNWSLGRSCSTCNFSYWLEAITRSMTGLKFVKITLMIPGLQCPCPTLKDAWVVRLLQLQRQSNAVVKVVSIAHPNTGLIKSERIKILRQTRVFGLQLKDYLDRIRRSKEWSSEYIYDWQVLLRNNSPKYLNDLDRLNSEHTLCRAASSDPT